MEGTLDVRGLVLRCKGVRNLLAHGVYRRQLAYHAFPVAQTALLIV